MPPAAIADPARPTPDTGHILGLDVGGAHLKFCDRRDWAETIPFPLWKQPSELAPALRQTISERGPYSGIALTMTGELADCYPDKPTGVRAIIDAVVHAAAGTPVSVWQTAGEFVAPAVACEFPSLTASANWHALATWAARMTVPQTLGLLIDLGSTTVDVIPLHNGQVAARGRTDRERLANGELLYTGGKRTPLCALRNTITLHGEALPVAAELFATTDDLFVWLGRVPERPDDTDTADGRPATRPAAAQRIARMLCCDATECTDAELHEIVAQFAAAQRALILQAIRRVLADLTTTCQLVLTSGSASFLLDDVWSELPELQRAERLNLQELLGPDRSSAACAFAVAELASERDPF